MFKQNNMLLAASLLSINLIHAAAGAYEEVMQISPLIYACAAAGLTTSEFNKDFNGDYNLCTLRFGKKSLLMLDVNIMGASFKSEKEAQPHAFFAIIASKNPEWDGVYERGDTEKNIPAMDKEYAYQEMEKANEKGVYKLLCGYGLGGELVSRIAKVAEKDVSKNKAGIPKYAVTFNAINVIDSPNQFHFVAEEYSDMPEFSPKSKYIVIPKNSTCKKTFGGRSADVVEVLRGLISGTHIMKWQDFRCSAEFASRGYDGGSSLGSLLDFRMQSGDEARSASSLLSLHAGRDSEYAREADAVEREYAHGSRIRKMREQKERDRDAERQREREKGQ